MKKNKLPKEEYFNEDGFFEPKISDKAMSTAIIILAIIGVCWGIYFFITL